MTHHATGLLVLLALAGCSELRAPPAYYGGAWDPPTVSALSVTRELGLLGGGEIQITGSGFGTDPDQLVVVFGDHNAEILTAADNVLTVRVPAGPLTAGAVDVKVATPTGFVVVEGGYTYDAGEGYAEQRAYVQVNNFWESCLGGLSARLDEEWASELGGLCETVSYMGYTGLTGASEGFDHAYPRVHSPGVGWFLGGDVAGPEWVVERPGLTLFPAGIDDLHDDIGEVVLRNEFWEGEDPWCANLDTLATYHYGGGLEDAADPYTLYVADVVDGRQREECDSDQRAYDLAELRFCTADDEAGVPTHLYEADWPVVENFFASSNRQLQPVEVTLDLPDVGLEGQPLVLPESIVVLAPQGFEGSDDPEADAALWSLLGIGGCFDDDGNGERLNDVALSFTWVPSEFAPTEEGVVVGHQTYVRFTLTHVSYNWLGPINYPTRATITVPDDFNYTNREGVSRVDVPAEVLYQFPTITLPVAGGLGGEASLLDPGREDWGYLVVTVERVTEYTLEQEGEGTIVFSYATGDLGIFEWANPREADSCHNCADDDGDGWSDALDADCVLGTEEDGTNDTTECSDGRDNDHDGVRDEEDSDCSEGADDEESNCDDGVDNDRDGVEDAADPECQIGSGEGVSCEDGIDNDDDDWSDGDDPECVDGGEEVAGFGPTACNNGVDDDGDGLVDGDDSECSSALDETEAPDAPPAACGNGLDDDGDLLIDLEDPDCTDASDEDEAG